MLQHLNKFGHPMFDRERLFQMLFAKEWDGLSEQLYLHRNLLGQDPVLQQVAQLFDSEFVGHLRGLPASEQVKTTRHISMLIASKRSSFKESFWRPVIEIKLEAMYEVKDISLSGVASEWANEIPLARDLLVRLQQERPEELADARRSALNIKAVTAAPRAKPIQHVTSIFKSPQERAFYLAMLEAVPKLLPCPNLAMSVALDYPAIEPKISAAARSYFFRAQFDCVAVDPAQDYRPLHFFELDSTFHDTAEAIARDRMKDEICSAAGIKLLRLRAFEQMETTQAAFMQLIREVLPPVFSRKSSGA
ncbi:MAG: DUF2726 domain-containing protein [Variovorax sp.]|jgi:Protein of unknown function (DUF2726)|nr:MAG: DUF2726 domain-containing protein [Variovorax sp.]